MIGSTRTASGQYSLTKAGGPKERAHVEVLVGYDRYVRAVVDEFERQCTRLWTFTAIPGAATARTVASRAATRIAGTGVAGTGSIQLFIFFWTFNHSEVTITR